MLSSHHCEECILLKVPQQSVARMHCHDPRMLQVKPSTNQGCLFCKQNLGILFLIAYLKMLDMVSFKQVYTIILFCSI